MKDKSKERRGQGEMGEDKEDPTMRFQISDLGWRVWVSFLRITESHWELNNKGYDHICGEAIGELIKKMVEGEQWRGPGKMCQGLAQAGSSGEPE